MKSKQEYSSLLQRIEGGKASLLDKVAQEYKLLEIELKEKQARYDELKSAIKLELGEGKYETANYMFSLYLRDSSKTLDKDVLAEIYPNVYNDPRIWKAGSPSLVLGKVERKN